MVILKVVVLYRVPIPVSSTDQDGATCVVSEWPEHLPLYNEVWEESHWWHLCYLGHVDAPLQRNSRDYALKTREDWGGGGGVTSVISI